MRWLWIQSCSWQDKQKRSEAALHKIINSAKFDVHTAVLMIQFLLYMALFRLVNIYGNFGETFSLYL
jgi:hypothetical protein